MGVDFGRRPKGPLGIIAIECLQAVLGYGVTHAQCLLKGGFDQYVSLG